MMQADDLPVTRCGNRAQFFIRVDGYRMVDFFEQGDIVM
jgi:hypothetical protein